MNNYLGKIFMALTALVLLTLSPGCKKDRYALNYSHNLHVVENEMECSTCHKPAAAGAMGRPGHGVCSECHEIDEDNPSAECLKCHRVRSPERIEVKYPEQPEIQEIIFSHEKHKYIDAACRDCHTRAAGSASSKENVLPPKEACLPCHDDQTAPLKDCSVCHAESSPVNATHRLDWEMHHGLESKMANSNCLTCHSEDTCIECHQDEKPRDHNNTWRKITHSAEAAWNRSRCMVCHQEDFCERCHSNTRPRSHRTAGWTAGPTLHCSQCHIPAGPVGCSVCHKEAEHETAIDSPHPPFGVVSPACNFCHPIVPQPPHSDPGVDCTVCHER